MLEVPEEFVARAVRSLRLTSFRDPAAMATLRHILATFPTAPREPEPPRTTASSWPADDVAPFGIPLEDGDEGWDALDVLEGYDSDSEDLASPRGWGPGVLGWGRLLQVVT